MAAAVHICRFGQCFGFVWQGFGSGGEGVLVSAGIELIVFLVAGTVLCFEFSMRRMLITLMFSVVAQ